MSLSSSGAAAPSPEAPPPPDPVYTFRPYAGEITAVQYVTLPGGQAAIASGYLMAVVILQIIWCYIIL